MIRYHKEGHSTYLTRQNAFRTSPRVTMSTAWVNEPAANLAALLVSWIHYKQKLHIQDKLCWSKHSQTFAWIQSLHHQTLSQLSRFRQRKFASEIIATIHFQLEMATEFTIKMLLCSEIPVSRGIDWVDRTHLIFERYISISRDFLDNHHAMDWNVSTYHCDKITLYYNVFIRILRKLPTVLRKSPLKTLKNTLTLTNKHIHYSIQDQQITLEHLHPQTDAFGEHFDGLSVKNMRLWDRKI